MRCETCQKEATVHVEAIGCHFCASCLKKIDERIAEINAAEHRAENPVCHECGGHHEPSGARSDCIRHWKLRALQAENTASVESGAAVGSSALFGHLERLIKEKGQLDVTHTNGGGVGLYWSSTIGGEWPYCGGGTLEGALRTLVSEHLRLEREELQKRIKAIDESAGL